MQTAVRFVRSGARARAAALRLTAIAGVALFAVRPATAHERVERQPSSERPRAVVVTLEGREGPLRGRLLEIGRDTLSLLVEEKKVELPLTKVLRVETREKDSIVNGAVIGALAAAAWCAYICAEAPSRVGAAVGAGISGALIGAAIDYSIKPKPVTLYARPPDVASRPRPGFFVSVTLVSF